MKLKSNLLLSLGLVANQWWQNANGFRVSHSSSSSMTIRTRTLHHVDRLLLLQQSSSVSTPSPYSALYSTAWKNPFESLFSGVSDRKSKQRQEDDILRQRLVAELLEKCSSTPRYSKPKRESIEQTMNALTALSPIKETATSPLLQKEWKLIWTTEKEINFFLDWGLSNDIRQTISNGTTLQNMIQFKTTGYFAVQGRLSIPKNNATTGIRTNFEFESATLNLGSRWGEYTLPPIGAGWFDTIYLDDTLRIDSNSRNDILICSSAD